MEAVSRPARGVVFATAFTFVAAGCADQGPSAPPPEPARPSATSAGATAELFAFPHGRIGQSSSASARDPARGGRALTWAEQQKLRPTSAHSGDLFGAAVVFAGGGLLVGAPTKDSDGAPYAGAVFELVATPEGWAQVDTIRAGAPDGPQSTELFGLALEADAGWLAVGASQTPPREVPIPPTGPGAVYLFERVGDEWTQRRRVSRPDGVTGDAFGMALAIDGENLLVGAPGSDPSGNLSGAVHAYRLEAGTWTDLHTLLPSDGAAGDFFGGSIALDGTTAVVGAPTRAGAADDDVLLNVGAAYVFELEAGTWVERQLLVPEIPTEQQLFGSAVALEGATLLVSAKSDTDAGTGRGAVFVYRLEGSIWALRERLVPDGGDTQQLFGSAIALEGDRALVGAASFLSGSLKTGAAYAFERVGGFWELERRVVGSDLGDEASFGASLDLAGDLAAIGAPLDPNPDCEPNPCTFWAGSAFVFAHDKHEEGDPCASGAECASGYCVDDVCCDGPCGGDVRGDCESCSVATGAAQDGQCTELVDAACDDGLYCNGADSCSESGCTVHAGSPCPGPDDDEDCAESCDEERRDCSAADPDGLFCAEGRCRQGICAFEGGASCNEPNQCQSGYCVGGVCCDVPSCAPFACGVAGECRAGCESTNDCAQGYQCTSDQRCVSPAAADGSDGCGCALPGRSPEQSHWTGSLLALGLLLRLRGGRGRSGHA